MSDYVYGKKTNELVKVAGNASNADLKNAVLQDTVMSD